MTNQYPYRYNTTQGTASQDDPRYETPGGAANKIEQALEDAKEYTDAELLSYVAQTVNLADDSVTRPKIAPGAVGATELDPSLLDYTTDIAVAAKFNEVDAQLADIALNVKTLGAVPGGVVDSTSAIQTAIDTVFAAGGGDVYIPDGQYLFNRLTMRSKVRLKGSGKKSTTLITYNSTETIITIHGSVGTPLTDIGIDGMTIYTPNISDNQIVVSMQAAYYFSCTDFRLLGSEVNRKGIGFQAIGTNTGYYGTFMTCSFSSYDKAVRLFDSANAHRFLACDFYNCNIDAEVIDSNGINFFGCTFQDFHKKAIHFNDSGAGRTNRNSLFGCYIEALGSGPDVECGIDINSTTKTTMLFGNLYNNLRPTHQEVIDNSKTTTRIEWNSTSYAETLKLPTFTNLPSFDDATKPAAITETRGSIVHLTTSGQVDKLGAIMNNAAGTPLWAQVMVAVSNVLNLSGLTLQNGKIQQFNDGNILLGTLADTTERQMNYDTGFKMVRYHDGAGWHYLQGNRSGTTANRPTIRFVGMEYFDSTINKPVWWNGTAWVDATGTTV